MAKRPILVQQLVPRPLAHGLAIVPVGLYLNKGLQKAEPGDAIEFRQSWRRDRRVLVRKAQLPVNSAVFTLLMKAIYGEGMTWKELSGRWEAECIIDGIGAEAFSRDNVLLIEVKEIEDNGRD